MQVQNKHVDKVVANVTLRGYVETALFYVFLEFSKIISISICKPKKYLDCVTSKEKGLWILDVLATFASQNRVHYDRALYILVVRGFVHYGIRGIV